ncbi:hypothetical protein SAMN05443144_105166 [Fodinibius roseus]|uniref:Uncharacterized protein n=1 Tax=Fodinibius roseus TaxID=1194090 RepID=A0A1M4YV06_9BACT|nr:hypothetical protein [Fodinibius roseus]SHF09603.1 hypothetical protein SAMN05443144_105166 [Fodinibius roseus]
MKIRTLHYFSGLLIVVFTALHLFNHLFSIVGADTHIQMMELLRTVYRNSFVEFVLLLAVGVQIFSGLALVSRNKRSTNIWEKMHIYSGLYLAFFLAIHTSAVLTGRFLLELDTNVYFGASGLNSFPYVLFFIPYYGLAISSFFVHIACIHYKRMNNQLAGLTVERQSILIIITGVIITVIIFYGLTDGFRGLEIPTEYQFQNLNC